MGRLSFSGRSAKSDVMHRWQPGETVVVRAIARSDGSVAMATPTIAIRHDEGVLAVFVPRGTQYRDNYAVSPDERADTVAISLPSTQRPHALLTWKNDSIRLYLPRREYSASLFLPEEGEVSTCYGDLQAPFVGTRIGIDTQDHALDVIAHVDGRWWWKDEGEFSSRLEAGVDSTAHQSAVRAAGAEFLQRWARRDPPFDERWDDWRPPTDWTPRALPNNWADDFGTGAVFDAARR